MAKTSTTDLVWRKLTGACHRIPLGKIEIILGPETLAQCLRERSDILRCDKHNGRHWFWTVSGMEFPIVLSDTPRLAMVRRMQDG